MARLRYSGLLAVLLAVLVAGTKNSFEIKLPQSNARRSDTMLTRFGVSSGSKLSINATVSSSAGSSAYLMAFDARTWTAVDAILSDTVIGRDACSLPSTMRVELPANQETRETVTLSLTEQLRFEIMMCGAGVATVKGDFHIYNVLPDGQKSELALEDRPLIDVNIFMLVLYAIVTPVWALYCWRNVERLNLLQYLFCVTLLLKLLQVATKLAWLLAEDSLLPTAQPLEYTHAVFNVLSTSIFLYGLLQISIGWGVTTLRPTVNPIMLVASSVGLIVVGHLSSFACIQQPNSELCNGLLLLEYVVRFVIMLGIIMYMNFNITGLRVALDDHTWAPSSASLYTHLSLYLSFRWAFLTYLLLPTGLLLFQITVLNWSHAWMVSLLNELLLLAIYCHIGYTFRPHIAPAFVALGNAINQGLPAVNAVAFKDPLDWVAPSVITPAPCPRPRAHSRRVSPAIVE